MTDDVSRELVRRHAVALLTDVRPRLSDVTAAYVDELLDANEFGLAVETISDALVSTQAAISRTTLHDVAWLVDTMRMEPDVVDRLRPLAER